MLVFSLITNGVSASTIIRHEEEIFKHGNYNMDVPCVVQWSLLWFSAPARLNKILGHELKIKKDHEVVNSVIMDAIVRTFGEHTPRSCMLTSVARVPHSTHRKWRVNKEMEGWMVRKSIQPSSSDGVMKTIKVVMNIASIGSRGLFQLRNNAQGIPVVFMLIPQKKKTVQC